METFFASPERASKDTLAEQIQAISCNPVIDGMMKTLSGLFAVLNENRQVLAINESFLQYLGLESSKNITGLRPGEIIQCSHAHDMSGGCGTSQYCSSCGAAIAIVSTLATEKPIEKKCIVSVNSNGKLVDLCLSVRSSLISFEDQRFVLLFIQDVTLTKRREELERAFFHDINNLLTSLVGLNKLIGSGFASNLNEIHEKLDLISKRLIQEVAIQRTILHDDKSEYNLTAWDIPVTQIVREIIEFFAYHPVAESKSLNLSRTVPDAILRTDASIVLRVLSNMTTNAFEATEEGRDVKFWVEERSGEILFHVWSHQTIAEETAARIFQRHFSTKQGTGRGLGTYSMKLLGEDILGGRVSFTTGDEGTTFSFSLPL